MSSKVSITKPHPHFFRAGLQRVALPDLEARIAADQAKRRAEKERWLEIEREKYRLPRRGRLIDDMPA